MVVWFQQSICALVQWSVFNSWFTKLSLDLFPTRQKRGHHPIQLWFVLSSKEKFPMLIFLLIKIDKINTYFPFQLNNTNQRNNTNWDIIPFFQIQDFLIVRKYTTIIYRWFIYFLEGSIERSRGSSFHLIQLFLTEKQGQTLSIRTKLRLLSKISRNPLCLKFPESRKGVKT